MGNILQMQYFGRKILNVTFYSFDKKNRPENDSAINRSNKILGFSFVFWIKLLNDNF